MANPISLLNGWSTFVASVEQGYGFGLYEYLNDLDARVLLRQRASGTPMQEDIAGRLNELDARFLALTTDGSHLEPLARHFDASDAWLARVPKRLVGELKEDLGQ